MNYALSPFERRNEYYNNIKLGNDLNKQTQMISEASKSMISAQMKSANSIISSQERINEGIDALSYKINDVNEGLSGLKAAFEFGISEVVWQIEQNRKVLKNILEVLLAPLDTQAKELRKRAEEAYSNGWMDEAIDDFLESEKKNKYDFSVHISIGMIYLFSIKNKEKALEYFEKAAKYSKPKSSYHASFSLLHAAFIKYQLNSINEASLLSDEACNLTPNLPEALYQNALYHAMLKKPEISIPCIKKAISIDINYCEKVLSEDSFKHIEKEVNQMFIELRNIEKQKALKKYGIIKEIKNSIIETINKAMALGINQKKGLQKETIKYFNQTVNYIKRNSYRDLIDANKYLSSLHGKLINEFDIIEDLIKTEIYQYSNKINSFKPKLIDVEDVKDRMYSSGLYSLLPFISFLIGAPIEFGAAGVGMAIACAIPVIGHGWLLIGLIYLLFGNSFPIELSGENPFQAAANSAVVCLFLAPLYFWLTKLIPNSINKMREDEFENNVQNLKIEEKKYNSFKDEVIKLHNQYSLNDLCTLSNKIDIELDSLDQMELQELNSPEDINLIDKKSPQIDTKEIYKNLNKDIITNASKDYIAMKLKHAEKDINDCKHIPEIILTDRDKELTARDKERRQEVVSENQYKLKNPFVLMMYKVLQDAGIEGELADTLLYIVKITKDDVPDSASVQTVVDRLKYKSNKFSSAMESTINAALGVINIAIEDKKESFYLGCHQFTIRNIISK